MLGIPKIGIRMIDDPFLLSALETRILLMTLAKVVRNTLAQHLAELNPELSVLQYSVLRTLNHEGNLTLSELSRRFSLDPSTLVPSVDGLERHGLVRRERDPEDRRRLPLLITEEGRALLMQVDVLREDDPLMVSLRSLGPAPADLLRNMLRAAVQHLPDGEVHLENARQRFNSYQSCPKSSGD